MMDAPLRTILIVPSGTFKILILSFQKNTDTLPGNFCLLSQPAKQENQRAEVRQGRSKQLGKNENSLNKNQKGLNFN